MRSNYIPLIIIINYYAKFVNCSFLHTEIEDDIETEIRDWSEAQTDGIIRSLSFLIGIDSSLAQYYNYEEEKIRAATVTLFHTVVQYFYPLNIRMKIVDILPVKGVQIALDDFIAWKKEQRNLINHDVTVLLRHNYEGGIAYGNALCTNNSLMISGFFPEETMSNAWVLIHQLAHVIGVTHKITTKCNCKKQDEGKCLKIRGFPQCSVQEMMNALAMKKCFMDNKIEFSSSDVAIPTFSLPICGNGLMEKGEDCDCGPSKFCDNPFCDATNCKFVLEKKWLTLMIPAISAFFTFLILLCIWKFGILRVYYALMSKASKWKETRALREQEKGSEISNPAELLTSSDATETAVRMRPQRDVEAQVPNERRQTRFSEIYMTMRPISRFWEKFKNPHNDNVPAAPI